MKRCLLLLSVLLMFAAGLAAQPATSQRLYQLCKVWGYLKYHHPSTCTIRWNDVLLEKLDSVINSGSAAAFDSILYNLCLEAGTTARPAASNIILGDSARNYRTAWFYSPGLAPRVRDFLDSVQAHRVSNSTGCLLRRNFSPAQTYNSYIDFRYDSILNVPGFSYANLQHRLLVYF